jgi:regulation of enolase protein 1 (concanavalin A-like superfamily)
VTTASLRIAEGAPARARRADGRRVRLTTFGGVTDDALPEQPWEAGRWTTPPAAVVEDGADLLVTAAEGSDAWRHTSYGFVHDDAHALLAPLADPGAVEVTFDLGWNGQFDQAGLMLRVDAETWLKAGVEVADGAPSVGAVVTLGRSDWSVAPVPGWAGRRVTVRASRHGDAVTVRARADDEPFRLVRVAPFPPGAAVLAGPYCCAPTRAGLVVRFRRWTTGPADAALH